MNIYQHNGLFIESSSLEDYYRIINNAQQQVRTRRSRASPDFIYYENHHILPRSIFPKFINEKWNQVLLTADEHLISHKLLTIFTFGDSQVSMFNAYWNMATRTNDSMNRIELTPVEYRLLRERISEIRHNTKRPHTELTKAKISIANKVKHNNNDYTKRKNHSRFMAGPGNPSLKPGVNQKQKESRLRYIKENPTELLRLRKLLKSRPNPMLDPENIKKVSGDNHYSRNPANKKHCQWCDRNIAPSSFSQFHDDKCKLNPNRLTLHANNDIIKKMNILLLDNITYNLANLPDEVDDVRFAILDNSNPQAVDYHYIPLIFLESFNAPALVLRIGENIIKMPVDWQILIGEKEHGDLETLPLTSINDRGFNAFVFNPLSSFSLDFLPIEILDIYHDVTWYAPRLKNGQFLCVPIETGPKPRCAYFVKEISRNCEIVDVSQAF